MSPRIGLTTTPSVLENRPVASLNQSYVDAVVRAGGLPLVLPVLDPCLAEEVVAGLDGLLLTGGGDVDPSFYRRLPSADLGVIDMDLDRWELALAHAAAEHRIPVLGICRGSQVLNVARGGTLVQHLPDRTELEHCVKDRSALPVHGVRIDGGSRLRAVLGADVLGVNSLHHQGVDEVGEGLAAVAWADDGTVEAVESTGPHRMLGVQWHPELLVDEPRHASLFDWLAREARQPAPATVPGTVAA